MAEEKNEDNADRISQIFFPRSQARQLEVEQSNRRFVHYTSAAAATNILSRREFWMRDPTCMNDFTEVEHGLQCLFAAYKGEKHGLRFQNALNDIHAGITKDIELAFNNSIYQIRDCYLTCVSEHKDEEDKLGRLSMWRAYGNGTGVAIVMNNRPFFHGPGLLKIYTMPVEYYEGDGFEAALGAITDNIVRESEFLKTIERKALILFIVHMLRYATLSTKHPGFAEECEWRAIYSPGVESSPYITKEVEIIHGTPQPVYKVPLRSLPDGTETGGEMSELIERIIIGPSQFSFAVWKAFVHLLGEAGFEKPESRVFISGVPLR